MKRAVIALLLISCLALLVSAGKELHDSRTTGFSGTDLLAGAAGGATIVVVKF